MSNEPKTPKTETPKHDNPFASFDPLAYWGAFMANASFDVFIEGPMGGIWLWTVFGAGLAAVWTYRRHPELFDDCDASPATNARARRPDAGVIGSWEESASSR